MKNLTKRTKRNENSNLGEEAVIASTLHDNKKAFSYCASWYNFLIFNLLCGHEQGAPHFLAREEQPLSFKIVGSVVSIEAFVEHYPEFLRQQRSSIGNGLNVSIMNFLVGLAYYV